LRIPSKNHQYVDLIQLTDCHLEQEASTTLASVNTDDSLAAILDEVISEQADAIFATGDIASGGSIEAYQRFMKATELLSPPLFWLPGNHDSPVTMSALKPLVSSVTCNNWLLIQLNSKQPERVGGLVGEQQRQVLQRMIAATAAEHVLIFIHHHTVDIGCAWIDGQKLDDHALFWQAIEDSKVRAVVCGHVHQASDVLHQQVRVISTPSTCIQFKTNSDDFALSDEAPGYRRLRLHINGDIDTTAVRLQDQRFSADLNCSGY
jgi:Icc protein